MSADGEVRPVLQQIHGRHPGARVDALTAEESGQGGQRGAGLTAYGKKPGSDRPLLLEACQPKGITTAASRTSGGPQG